MKIIPLIIFGLVLLGAGCKSEILQTYSRYTTATYAWSAYDRVRATSTVLTFEYPSGYAVKENGNAARNEKIVIGGILGRIEIYNQDLYNINNNDLYPARPNEIFTKGNFYVYLFHNKADQSTKDELLKIVNSIKIK